MEFQIKNGLLTKCKEDPGAAELIIPAGVASIDVMAVSGCQCRRILIPDGVKNIGDCAFTECHSLEEIVIPESVENIGHYVFWNCPKLRVIKLRPDDPAFFRNYGTLHDLGKFIEKALYALRTGDYSIIVNTAVKYPFAMLHYLHNTGDEPCTAFIRRSFIKIMKTCISAGDTEFIRAMAQTDTFINKKNIDGLIAQAQQEQKHDIAALLLEYRKGGLPV